MSAVLLHVVLVCGVVVCSLGLWCDVVLRLMCCVVLLCCVWYGFIGVCWCVLCVVRVCGVHGACCDVYYVVV